MRIRIPSSNPRSSAHRGRPGRRSLFQRSLCLAALFALSCQPAPSPHESSTDAPPPKLLDGLGEATHPIETDSELGQRYFDQGLILTFGFNHDAAIRSFEEAARLDPDCAMCQWGIALALGPNINAPMGPEAAKRAYQTVQRAGALVQKSGNPREAAYIEALATRYAPEVPEDRKTLDLAYAQAMRGVHEADPSDLDAATLYAESLMDLYPWAYWTPAGEPREYTDDIVRTLEDVMAADPQHVGANHYYIHAVEEFFPEKGEPAADRLGDVAPDAGHLVHMPSHIYWRVGRYEDAAEINIRAAAADEQYFAWCRPGALYRSLYYPHNVHFLWAAAAAEGRRDLALMTARKLAAATKDSLDESPFLQEFVAIPMLTMARFGLWDSVLGEPAPADDQVFLIGTWYYVRGLAFARQGDIQAASEALQRVRAIAAEPAAAQLGLAGGVATAARLLTIASDHLDGEIARAEGRLPDAVDALERAVAGHDALAYMEPPPWYAPPRQVLGALLLDLDRAELAEAVYREDLRQYPKNGWSLLGLSQSLRARGKETQADWAQKGFEAAWARADVALDRSHL